MKLKKSAKNRKNEKRQHLMGCFKSKKEFKINFWNLCLFLAYFEQKVAKNVIFVIFSKTVSFGKNLTLPISLVAYVFCGRFVNNLSFWS